MNWYKKAKHISPISQYCIYCKNNITPHSFSRNPKHHFPWGINYKCSCGKSGLWSNSIRGEQEFIDHVFNNKKLENFPFLEGFCNDLFCPICYSNIQVLKNGLLMDNYDNPIIYINKNYYYISNYNQYILDYTKNIPINIKKPYVSEKTNNNINKSVDIQGCKTLQHNIGIIRRGYSEEYGEGEYQPIYEWIKNNKSKIPQEMINEFKNSKNSKNSKYSKYSK